MQGLEEIAIRAIEFRRDRNYNFGELVGELERKCTPEEVRQLLEWAEQVVPHPLAPRALRILKAAARAARRGDTERVKRLYDSARELLGDDHEFFAIIEEYRLSFCVQALPAEPARIVRHGFALASFA